MQILKIQRVEVENLTVSIDVMPADDSKTGTSKISVTVEYDNPKMRSTGEPPRLSVTAATAADLSAMLGFDVARQVSNAVARYFGFGPTIR
jgi:hypothetical protein